MVSLSTSLFFKLKSKNCPPAFARIVRSQSELEKDVESIQANSIAHAPSDIEKEHQRGMTMGDEEEGNFVNNRSYTDEEEGNCVMRVRRRFLKSF